jgi:effector-binding domain-containing protein
MHCARLAVTAVLAVALTAPGLETLRAQTAAPAQQPAAPAAPASPPAAQSGPTPIAPPVATPTPPTTDKFGEEVNVPAKTVVQLKGNGTWDSAFDTLMDSFKSLYGFLEREKIKPAGPPMTVYTSTDDTGFEFTAAVPIEAAPANPPKGDIEIGQSPSGKMLKFVHRGSYDAMDSTYESITNYLDSKSLEAADSFIEEYVTDPLTTPDDKLVVNVYVPIK